MAKTTTRTVNWAVEVASRLKGARFPLQEEEARRRLEGMTVKGKAIDEVLDQVEFPMATPAILLRAIAQSLD